MIRHFRYLGLAIAVALVLTPSLSCSIIGGVVGALGSKSETSSIPGWQIAEVKPGSEIRVQTNSGVVYAGEFVAIYNNLDPEYLSLYEQARAADEDIRELPDLNAEITLTREGMAPITGRILGFDLSGIVIRRQENMAATTIDYSTIRDIRSGDENGIPIETISDLMAQKRIPIISRIIVSTGKSTDMVFVQDVALIEYTTKSNHAATGFLVGAVVDVVILIAINEANERDKKRRAQTTYSGSFSCPFIYSFDGTDYVLDGETFGGAIFEAAQRSDLDNLDYLRSIDGEYRLMLTNELAETQFIDELNLLVVDHPVSTEVYPSFDGQLHILSAPQPAVSAVDASSRDISTLLATRDGEYWTSNPFGRSADSHTDIRDYIDLEFPAPDRGLDAKLVVNVKNTLWASYLQGQMIALMGDSVDAWYDLMNSSESARRELVQTMIREGMLLVKLWQNGEWKSVGYVWEVGPSIAKDQVVSFTVPESTAPTLKIRLESTAGLWTIDQARIDYSSPLDFTITEVSPKSAQGHAGENLLDELNSIDKVYYEMPSTEYWADVRYDEPPRREALKRTVLVKSTGYYTIHPPSVQEANPELIATFIQEPQAYGRFTINMLNQLVQQAQNELQTRGQ